MCVHLSLLDEGNADATGEQANMIQPTGVVCPACSSVIPTPSMAVQLENQIRSHVSKYYLGYTVCDGEGCGARTRMMGVYGRRCLGMVKEDCKGTVRLEVGEPSSSGRGRRLTGGDVQYPDAKLYNQLLFYHHLFDTEKALSGVRGTGRFGEWS